MGSQATGGGRSEVPEGTAVLMPRTGVPLILLPEDYDAYDKVVCLELEIQQYVEELRKPPPPKPGVKTETVLAGRRSGKTASSMSNFLNTLYPNKRVFDKEHPGLTQLHRNMLIFGQQHAPVVGMGSTYKLLKPDGTPLRDKPPWTRSSFVQEVMGEFWEGTNEAHNHGTGRGHHGGALYPSSTLRAWDAGREGHAPRADSDQARVRFSGSCSSTNLLWADPARR